MRIVEVENLAKRYRQRGRDASPLTAVDGISFSIEQGEIFGILGPNGAGKSTTLEMVEGLREIDEGAVRVAGISVRDDPQAVKQRIGVQLQASEYFDHLTLAELLTLFGALYKTRVAADDLLAKVDLADKRNAFTSQLSGGQKQRFSIASALVNDPDVLFLDEPTTGLDPHARHNLWDLVRAINAAGTTVVLTTHYMEEAEQLCSRVAIMNAGRIITLDTPANLIARYAPNPSRPPATGTLEDVFLALTGETLVTA